MNDVIRIGSVTNPAQNVNPIGDLSATQENNVEDFSLKKPEEIDVEFSEQSKSLATFQKKIHALVENVVGETLGSQKTSEELISLKDTQRLLSLLGPAVSRKYHTLIDTVVQHNIKLSGFLKDIAESIDSHKKE